MSMTFNQTDLAIYEDVKNGEYQAPSVYTAALKQPIKFTPENIENRLKTLIENEKIGDILVVEEQVNPDTQVNEIIIVLSPPADEDEEETGNFVFFMSLENEDIEGWSYEAAEYRDKNLLEDERMEMHQAQQFISCVTYLPQENAQEYLMMQYAVMSAVCGECYAILDRVASVFLSGTWLADIAQSIVPPSTELYYVIHVVVPDEEDGDFWLHTHGLLKFGIPELEILRVKRAHLNGCQAIITTLVNRLINDPEMWHQDTTHTVLHSEGYDIDMHLMPWQTALRSDLLAPMTKGFFKKTIERFSGDLGEREEDNVHTEPSMVIFADIQGQAANLSELGDLLGEDAHIMQLLPNAETERMYYQAFEKLPLFSACFQRHQPEEGMWTYLAKIRCQSPSIEAVEHMWFKVQSMSEDNIIGTLINEPFNIPEMQVNQSYTQSLEHLTDWTIYSNPLQAAISPQNAFMLRRYLRAN